METEFTTKYEFKAFDSRYEVYRFDNNFVLVRNQCFGEKAEDNKISNNLVLHAVEDITIILTDVMV